MINAIIIDKEQSITNRLVNLFEDLEPNIKFKAFFKNITEAFSSLYKTDLVFINSDSYGQDSINLLLSHTKKNQVICIGNEEKDACKAFHINALDFILIPFDQVRIYKLIQRIHSRLKTDQFDQNEKKIRLLGLPTIDGFDFIPYAEVIKCEGLHSYTRIVLKNKKEVISSNNIGEIEKLLKGNGFFCPHKSYIINLTEIHKYSNEGVIYLKDGTYVPLARRRKSEFFKKIATL